MSISVTNVIDNMEMLVQVWEIVKVLATKKYDRGLSLLVKPMLEH